MAHGWQIAHFNIFVHAHKNANEPATSLQLWQNSGSSLLLYLYGICNTAFTPFLTIEICQTAVRLDGRQWRKPVTKLGGQFAPQKIFLPIPQYFNFGRHLFHI
jgi:hypothetical protein